MTGTVKRALLCYNIEILDVRHSGELFCLGQCHVSCTIKTAFVDILKSVETH